VRKRSIPRQRRQEHWAEFKPAMWEEESKARGHMTARRARNLSESTYTNNYMRHFISRVNART
jgi:hypothetical protein